MTSFKGYANDIENERVKIESMRSFLKIYSWDARIKCLMHEHDFLNMDAVKFNVDSFIVNVIVISLKWRHDFTNSY